MVRKELPLAITFITGMIFILANFLTPPTFVEINKQITTWYQLVTALFAGLGVVNLCRINGKRISQKRDGWVFSATLLVSMFGFMFIALYYGQQAQIYKDLYNNTIIPLNATMFSVLVFYIASAAYRAFRVRSLEASILLVTAAVVMLGRAPIGEVVFGKGVADLTTWILEVPNTAGMRGILLGATLGAIAMSIRVLIGIERAHFGGTGGE
jgi:hypothetical protein